MDFIEILKSVIYGIVEGITEWLPISSTGHLILFKEFMPMKVSEDFWNMFLVVIQLGAILAVVVNFWVKIWPFNTKVKNKPFIRYDVMNMWVKIIVACLPAAVIGLLFDEFFEKYLYKPAVVAAMLIIVGIAFIVIENTNRHRQPHINSLKEISYKDALIIGFFQLIAAIFPGTSRSGSTIIGGLLIGVNRTVAAEFTFFLAIPVMFGASLLKLVKFGFSFTAFEAVILLVGTVVSFVVSLIVIRFLMGYIKKHDFKVFGWYRIVLGIAVLGYFWIAR